MSDESQKKPTADSFRNFAAKLGVSTPGAGRGNLLNVGPNTGEQGGRGRENLLSEGHYEFNLITRNRFQLEAAYRGSWIVGRVIDCIAQDMTREGVILTTSEGAETVPEFQVYLKRCGVWNSLCRTIKWGRLYGGSIAVMQIEGQDLSSPLNIESVGKGQFKGLAVYDRWQLIPYLFDLIKDGPGIGLPTYYDIVLGSNINDPLQGPDGTRADQSTGRTRVHHTRCVRMAGIELPFWQAITEMLWGESVLERMWDRLIEFDTASLAAGSLITRANLRTVKIEGLRNVVAAGGAQLDGLMAQMEMMREFQNNEGITLLDMKDEFTSTAYTFAGLSDVLINFGQQVSGAAETPLTRLFGQSPVGLTSTGEGEMDQYHEDIKSKQDTTLGQPLESIVKVAWRSFTGQNVPKDLMIDFAPLVQLDDTEKATVAKTNADTIIEAHQEGLIKTSTAMKELKQASGNHGLFSNISDEEIEEAIDDPIPMPGQEQAEEQNTLPDKKTKEVSDSIIRKIRRWALGDEQKRAANGQFGEGTTVHKQSHQGNEISVKKHENGSHKLHINGVEQKGEHLGVSTAVQRGKTLIERKNKSKDEDGMKKKKAPVNDPGIPGTMKEFYKGTLKSSSGKTVTSKKQALAIGYSEEGKDEAVSDCDIIAKFVKGGK